ANVSQVKPIPSEDLTDHDLNHSTTTQTSKQQLTKPSPRHTPLASPNPTKSPKVEGSPEKPLSPQTRHPTLSGKFKELISAAEEEGLREHQARKEGLVGKRVSVYWPEYDKWYSGTVRETDNPKEGSHIVSYDDGDEVYEKLEGRGKVKYKILQES